MLSSAGQVEDFCKKSLINLPLQTSSKLEIIRINSTGFKGLSISTVTLLQQRTSAGPFMTAEFSYLGCSPLSVKASSPAGTYHEHNMWHINKRDLFSTKLLIIDAELLFIFKLRK